jgi:hypothetical protein
MTFEDPGDRSTTTDPEDRFNAKDNNGALLIVEVLELTDEMQTSNGPADAIRANVTVVDSDRAGAYYPDTLIFARVLKAQLRSKIGKTVLGRLGQGEASGSKTPPWILEAADDADKAKADQFVRDQAAEQAATRLTAADL